MSYTVIFFYKYIPEIQGFKGYDLILNAIKFMYWSNTRFKQNTTENFNDTKILSFALKQNHLANVISAKIASHQEVDKFDRPLRRISQYLKVGLR